MGRNAGRDIWGCCLCCKVFEISNGFQKYIDKVQEDALTAYPLTIEKETTNTTAILLSAVGKNKDDDVEKGKIKETKNLETMLSSVGKNDIKSFKKYIEDNQTKIDKMIIHIVLLQIYMVKIWIIK